MVGWRVSSWSECDFEEKKREATRRGRRGANAVATGGNGAKEAFTRSETSSWDDGSLSRVAQSVVASKRGFLRSRGGKGRSHDTASLAMGQVGGRVLSQTLLMGLGLTKDPQEAEREDETFPVRLLPP